jgi:hypothetical protein
VISEAELAPDTLAAAIDRAAALPPFAFGRDLGGAQRTGAILIDLLRGRAK